MSFRSRFSREVCMSVCHHSHVQQGPQARRILLVGRRTYTLSFTLLRKPFRSHYLRSSRYVRNMLHGLRTLDQLRQRRMRANEVLQLVRLVYLGMLQGSLMQSYRVYTTRWGGKTETSAHITCISGSSGFPDGIVCARAVSR